MLKFMGLMDFFKGLFGGKEKKEEETASETPVEEPVSETPREEGNDSAPKEDTTQA